MELVAWWWNGHWGRLARRDVRVYRYGDHYVVEAWDGGVEGRCRRWNMPERSTPEAGFQTASDLIDDLMSDSEGWRCMTQ